MTGTFAAYQSQTSAWDKNPSIAVVIPAYLAEEHIQSVLAGIPSCVSHVIVVNDASPDGTAQLAQHVQDSRIVVISHEQNQGVGGAVRTGYQKATELGAQIVVKMDSDGQMDPSYLVDLVAPIRYGKADYTKGNRFLHSRSLKTMPWSRRVGNIALSFLTKLASGYWNIFDPTNGYTAIHATALNYLDLNRVDRRFFFESSMLIELGIAQAVVRDVYIPALYKGENSSLSELDSFIRFPWKLLKGFLHRIIAEYFIHDFNIVSLLIVAGIPSILFGLAFGVVNWSRSAYLGVPATTGTVMIAILPLILGVQFLLQALTLDVQNIPTRPLQQESHDNDLWR